MIGEKCSLHSKIFEIKKCIGKGKSAHSYLIEHNNEKYVLKKMHNEPCSYYAFSDNKLKSELEAFHQLKQIGIRVPELITSNEQDDYLIKEYIEGNTAAQVIAENKLTEVILRQIFSMAETACTHGINLDYFPTNFVIHLNTLFYIDYEYNAYSDEWNLENWGIYYWANTEGMKVFLETGDHLKINLDQVDAGVPIKEPFASIVEDWICRFKK